MMKRWLPLFLLPVLLFAHDEQWEDCTPNYEFNLSGELLFTFDYLAWTTHSDGFYYAIEQTGNLAFNQDLINEEPLFTRTCVGAVFHNDFKKPNLNWQSGFRLGLHYLLPNYCMEVGVIWHHFHPKNHRHLDSQLPIFVPFTTFRLDRDAYAFGEETNAFTDRFATEVDGKWKLHLDLIDFQLAYPTCSQHGLEFNPHIDLRVLSLKQDLHVSARGEIQERVLTLYYYNNTDNFVADFNSKEWLRVDYLGVGPRFGIDLSWNFFRCIGLYGSVASTLAYVEKETASHVYLDRTNTIATPLYQSGFAEDLHLHEKRRSTKWCSRAITDAEIGMSGTFTLCGGACMLFAKVGWEHHYFYNQGMGDIDNHSSGFVSRDDNDLSTQGIHLSLGLIF